MPAAGVRKEWLPIAAVVTHVCVAPVYADDALLEGFNHPPGSAKPQVWWHWTGGQVNADEALADLEWMQGAGIGGLQHFDISLGPASDTGTDYGSEAWRKIVRASTAKAKSLGLEFAITSSPGWSVTGGPWVAPSDAMKKIVWSTVTVAGGQNVSLQLPRPPHVPGPYQDIPVTALGEHDTENSYFQDLVVLAVPAATKPPPVTISVSGSTGDLEKLQDGKFWPALPVEPDDNGEAWVLIDSAVPVTLKGITVGQPGRRGFGSPEPPELKLQSSDNGISFSEVASLAATKSLVRSASFAPVTARYFRLLLRKSSKPSFVDSLAYAPGVVPLQFPNGDLAFDVSEIQLHVDAHVNAVEEKAGFAPADDYYEIGTPTELAPRVHLADVIDLRDNVDAEGRLLWDAPGGDWDIIRMGCSLTGSTNGPATPSSTGLEVDKLDANKVSAYFDDYLENYRDGDGLYDGITGFLSDSIESGAQNCTDNLLPAFEERHGYDATRWLAAVTGRLIDSAGSTDRFFWDFRELIATLLQRNHYETLARKAREHGLAYYAEALEDHRPQLGNDLDMRSAANVPMAAFWYYPADRGANPTYVADVAGAASVANFYGKPYVAVEALTTFGHPWAVGPQELKRVADHAFALGANRLIMHSSVHQPDGRNFTPGQSMMPLLGHYLNRNVTWSDFADIWTGYIARSQFLLQQGRPIVDFAYFIGEEAPTTGLYGDKLPAGIPVGYDFDYVSASAIAELGVDNGVLVSPGGARYGFLYLGGSSRKMTVTTLRRLEHLAATGALIAGIKPGASPSLADDDEAFARLVDDLWAKENVLEAGSPGQVLAQLEVPPGWTYRPKNDTDPADTLAVRRRSIPGGQIVFVANLSGAETSGQLTFSSDESRKPVDSWHAVTGERMAMKNLATRSDRVLVDLVLDPHESLFLINRAATNRVPPFTVTADSVKQLRFRGDWNVEFDSRFSNIEMPPLRMGMLKSLHLHEEPDIRHYSGVTTYTNSFVVNSRDVDNTGDLFLEAKGVGDIARVYVNDEYAGALWTAPYRVNIAPRVVTGENTIRIEVANLWANRLIGLAGEEQPFAGFPTGIYQPDAPLRESGLVGPVSILRE